ncbi:MAG: T9SS type A sorting domain-containing protein [Bacteroidia bacterium]|nr:T9SS type A sorting domain-containing protein [Bacteroidia bacterium]
MRVSNSTKLLSCLIFIAGCWINSYSQEYRIGSDIVVKDINGQELKRAWSGGFDTVHPHNFDLNGDGRMDVVMTEFGGHYKRISFVPFVHVKGTEFRYAPEYEYMFDDCDCFEWAVLQDFNNDSIPDIFCGRNPGSNFKVYKTIEHCRDSFSFVIHKDPLNFQRNSEVDTSQVNQARTDIPGIADVDFDGDIDIITSNSFNGRLTYFKNLDVEKGNPVGTLEFDDETYCWGHFSENNLNEQLSLGDTTSFGCDLIYPWRRSSGARHSGTTILLVDVNGDSLMDVFLGDIESYRLTLVQNQGRKIEAFMNKAVYRYPQTDSSIYMAEFLASSYLDLNGDGLKDLAVTPHEPTPDRIETKNGMAWYENTGIPSLADFKFRDRTTIASSGIDGGYESLPEFLDYNNDGKMDICFGTRFSTDLVGGAIRTSTPFYMYENVGTASNPEYRFVSDNYIDFSSGPPFINTPEPAAGDLDNDGDTDMLIGASDGRIYYYINQATSGPTADFVLSPDVLLRDKNNVPIIVVNNAAPELHDYDGDGDLDLFVGNGLGRIYYYQNIGTASSFSFELVTDRFGDVRIRNSFGDTIEIVRPVMGDYNGDGRADLIVGSETGYIEIWTDAFQALQKPLSDPDTLMNRRFRARLSPAVAKLDESGDLTFVIGTEEGGLILVKKDTAFGYCAALTDTTTDSTGTGTFVPEIEGDIFKVFPNPVQNILKMEFSSELPFNSPKEAVIFNGLGQEMRRVNFRSDTYNWNLQGMDQGMYFLQISTGGKRYVHKFLIRR